jgi:hypothetical protein
MAFDTFDLHWTNLGARPKLVPALLHSAVNLMCGGCWIGFKILEIWYIGADVEVLSFLNGLATHRLACGKTSG